MEDIPFYFCPSSSPGMEACVFTTTKHTEVFARLRDFIITNVDPETVHKKVSVTLGVLKWASWVSLAELGTEETLRGKRAHLNAHSVGLHTLARSHVAFSPQDGETELEDREGGLVEMGLF